MNCVNCGAPPKAGSRECRYCETAIDHKEPRANFAGFTRAIGSFSDDYYRCAAVLSLQGSFTAGQVLEILRHFSDDYYRFGAAQRLAKSTLNPEKLYEAAELFHDDYYRTAFMTIAGGGAIEDDEEEEYDEDEEEEDDDDVPHQHFSAGWYVAAILLVFVILLLAR